MDGLFLGIRRWSIGGDTESEGKRIGMGIAGRDWQTGAYYH
jgi:hypothetical protein